MTAQRTIVVAGTLGVIGRAAASHLAAQPDTNAYGLSRRSSAALAGVEELSVDLLQPDDVDPALGGIGGITHIVFGAYIERATAAEKSEVNVALMRTQRVIPGA